MLLNKQMPSIKVHNDDHFHTGDTATKNPLMKLLRVFSIRNIFLLILMIFLVALALIVWGLNFRGSVKSVRYLTDRIRQQAASRVVDSLSSLFLEIQKISSQMKVYQDVHLDYNQFIWENETQKQALTNTQFALIQSYQNILNSVNFLFKDGTILAWETSTDHSTWIYYESDPSNLDFNIYTMDPVTRKPLFPPFTIPNFNMTNIIPTYHTAVNLGPATGRFFPISEHVTFHGLQVSSIARPYYDANNQLVGTINCVWHIETVKNLLISINPTKKGNIVVMEDSMAIVADSFEDSTPLIGVACGTNVTYTLALCKEIKRHGDPSDFGKSRIVKGMKVIRSEIAFPGIKWHVFIAIDDTEFFGSVSKQSYTTIWVTALILTSALVLSLVITTTFLRTLTTLSKAFTMIKRLEVEGRQVAKISKGRSVIYEIRELQQNFRSMLVAVQSMVKYVPQEVIKSILDTGKVAELGLVSRRCTIFFLDIQDFTTISERLAPEELIHLMSETFELCSSIIAGREGVIDKYVGDAIMAIWNAPRLVEDHELKAIDAALEIHRALMDAKFHEQGKPEIIARIGLHTATVLAGNFGSQHRFSYTVMGDGVNLASRLEAMNKHYGTKILISDETYNAASKTVSNTEMEGGPLVCRRVEKAAVKGKATSRLVYQVISHNGINLHPSLTQDSIQTYEDAFDSFIDGDFEEAYSQFSMLTVDQVINKKLEQCDHYMTSGKPYNWDGTVALDSK